MWSIYYVWMGRKAANKETVRYAKDFGKWFYFYRTDEWLAPTQVLEKLSHGEKVTGFMLRNPIEMLDMYKKLNENT